MKNLLLWFIQPYEMHKTSNLAFCMLAIVSAGTSLVWFCMSILIFKAIARVVQYGFKSLITPLEINENHQQTIKF